MIKNIMIINGVRYIKESKKKVKKKIKKKKMQKFLIGDIVEHKTMSGFRYHLGCHYDCGCLGLQRFHEKVISINNNKVKTIKLCGWGVQLDHHWEPMKSYKKIK